MTFRRHPGMHARVSNLHCSCPDFAAVLALQTILLDQTRYIFFMTCAVRPIAFGHVHWYDHRKVSHLGLALLAASLEDNIGILGSDQVLVHGEGTHQLGECQSVRVVRCLRRRHFRRR